jgi:16S rRNA (cytosine967-C5)-methyltransferase
MELDGRSGVEAILEANNETPDINIAALSNRSRMRLEEIGLEKSEVSPIGFIAKGNPEPFLDHETRVQDQGSQLVALTLLKLAKSGGKFLDMCSGPGGKAAVLLSGMNADSTLVCLEPTPHRAKLVEDALQSDPRARVDIRTGQTAEADSYDAVLLDAPCSGIGSLRRKPESRWRKLPGQLPQLNRTQHELLSAGLDALKPGGVLLYSTCSPVISETNSQIAQILESRKDCELIDIKPALLELSPTLRLNPERRTVQLWTDLHETDCMFLAAFRKH